RIGAVGIVRMVGRTASGRRIDSWYDALRRNVRSIQRIREVEGRQSGNRTADATGGTRRTEEPGRAGSNAGDVDYRRAREQIRARYSRIDGPIAECIDARIARVLMVVTVLRDRDDTGRVGAAHPATQAAFVTADQP